MAPSSGAILLAVALLSANAAWCESDPPPTAVTIASYEEGPTSQSVHVQETEVGILYAVAAGVRMALAREPFNSVWPSYAYKIDPASNNQEYTCQLLNEMPVHFADDAMILRSQDELGAQEASVEFMGYELKALDFCSSSAPNSVWPSYAHKIDPASNNQEHTYQLLNEIPNFADDEMIPRGQDELGEQASVDFYEKKALDTCGSGIEIYNHNNLATETSVNSLEKRGICNYLVTENLVPELDTWIWLEKRGIHYYLVTENPVPELELGARVWLEKSGIHNYLVTENPVPELELVARVWRTPQPLQPDRTMKAH